LTPNEPHTRRIVGASFEALASACTDILGKLDASERASARDRLTLERVERLAQNAGFRVEQLEIVVGQQGVRLDDIERQRGRGERNSPSHSIPPLAEVGTRSPSGHYSLDDEAWRELGRSIDKKVGTLTDRVAELENEKRDEEQRARGAELLLAKREATDDRRRKQFTLLIAAIGVSFTILGGLGHWLIELLHH
jgi:hypothetical protein